MPEPVRPSPTPIKTFGWKGITILLLVLGAGVAFFMWSESNPAAQQALDAVRLWSNAAYVVLAVGALLVWLCLGLLGRSRGR